MTNCEFCILNCELNLFPLRCIPFSDCFLRLLRATASTRREPWRQPERICPIGLLRPWPPTHLMLRSCATTVANWALCMATIVPAASPCAASKHLPRLLVVETEKKRRKAPRMGMLSSVLTPPRGSRDGAANFSAPFSPGASDDARPRKQFRGKDPTSQRPRRWR